MELSTFRTTQEPIKQRTRRTPKPRFDLARHRHGGRFRRDLQGSNRPRTGLAGIHPKAGGSGLELCSGDMLLEALIACAGVSMRAAAAVLDILVKSAVISAEGDVDLRGTLGITEEYRSGSRRSVCGLMLRPTPRRTSSLNCSN